MADLIDIIDDYFPANGDIGVPLNSTVTVLFSSEMDEDSLGEAFFVEGPDTDQFVGPGLAELVDPDNISQGDLDDFLKSPGYTGIVDGEFSFLKIDPSDDSLEISGSPYRTKLVFTPTQPLSPLVDYRAIITDCDTASGVTHSGHLVFSFQSGSGSIEELPSTTSSSILFSPSQAATTEYTPLEILSTTPEHLSIEQSGIEQILVQTNKAISSATLTSANVRLSTDPATEHPNITVQYTDGYLEPTLTASGTYIVVSDISSGIYANNIVTLELLSGIQATDGTSLTDGYDLQFMTNAAPVYSSVRKIRLEAGGYIGTVSDLAIQLANLEASLEADTLNFSEATTSDLYRHARRQYVTCVAAGMLVTNTGSSSLKSKTLGDLRVEYDTQGILDLNNRLRECIARWEPQLLSGGLAKYNAAPKGVIKGDLDPDRPLASRMWHSTETGVSRRIPASNSKVRYTTSRRYLRSYRKKYW